MSKLINEVWINALRDIVHYGDLVEPQSFSAVAAGGSTLELTPRLISVNMRSPVLTIGSRKLNYKFAAAEAHHILSGDDRVSTLEPYCKAISKYSDDGVSFFGAYGPKIIGQLEYVVRKLAYDIHTRQAGLVIWRENPPDTKDLPCTVAMFAQVRREVLDLHVFMRSSDVWMGLPYDVINFSLVAHLMCCELNVNSTFKHTYDLVVSPGTLHVTAASSHVYSANLDKACECLAEYRLYRYDESNMDTGRYMFNSEFKSEPTDPRLYTNKAELFKVLSSAMNSVEPVGFNFLTDFL